VLLNLHNAFIVSSLVDPYGTGQIPHRQQGFADYNPDKPADDPKKSYELSLTVTRDIKGGVEALVQFVVPTIVWGSGRRGE